MDRLRASLAPCPSTPNCVSTLATDSHRIEPFAYTGTPEETRGALLRILQAMPRTKITRMDRDAITVEFRTLVFRFVDDAMFVFDDRSKLIHFRSASRVGSGDLGVNRRRMEGIREKLTGGR